MRGWSLAAALLTVVGLPACRGEAESGGPRGGPAVLTPSDVHVLATSDSIAVVDDLQVLPDGSVWVLNSVQPFFLAFDPSGRLAAMYGKRGGGPEEFGLPTAFVTGGVGGEAWVLDFRRDALIQVSPAGTGRAMVPLPRDSIPPGSVRGGMDLMSPIVRTARLGDEVILPRTGLTLRAGILAFKLATLRPDLMALNPATGEVRKVVSLEKVMDDPGAGFEATEGGFPLWYRLWTVCGDHIRVYDRVRNEIRGFTRTGKEVDPIAMPPVRLTEVTPRQFAGVVFPLRQAEATGAVGERLTSADSAKLIDQMAHGTHGTPQQLAAYLPRYVDMRCSADGNLWMQPLDVDAGGLEGGRAWLRISPHGAAKEVDMPPRFDPYRFTSDRIWGVQRDELDVASIAWIELPEEK